MHAVISNEGSRSSVLPWKHKLVYHSLYGLCLPDFPHEWPSWAGYGGEGRKGHELGKLTTWVTNENSA